MKGLSCSKIITLVTLGILPLLPIPAFSANGTVSGSVLDSLTGKPISGAKTLLFVNKGNDSISSTADNYGNFVFSNVPEGNYSVRITHNYYADKLLQDVRVRNKRTTLLKRILMLPQPSGKKMVYVQGPAHLKLNDPTILWSDAIPLQALSPDDPPKPIPSETLHIQIKSYTSGRNSNDYKLREDFIDAVKKYGTIVSRDSAKANVFFRIKPKYLENGGLESVVFMRIDTRVKTRSEKLISNSRRLNNTAFAQFIADTIFNPWKIPVRTKQGLKIPKGVALITGKVLEKKTKEPIMGARVRLLKNGQSARLGAVTEEAGSFVILNIPEGIYDLEISYGPTYTKQLIKDVKVQTKRATDIGIIRLSEKPFKGDTVVILRNHYLK